MIIADWVAIAIVLLSLGIGALIGFGAGLKFFTGGIFGVILSAVACALIGTVFLDIGFVGDLLSKLSASWEGNEFLTKMHLETVIYYIILFVVIWFIRLILVLILKKFLEMDNFVAKFVNRTLGAVFFLALAVFIALLVLKIIGWVGGETATNLYDSLTGSLFNLDGLFEKINPGWVK